METPRIHFLHFAVIALLFYNLSITRATIETDRDALLSFRSQISSEPLEALSTWVSNMSPCNWTGVLCSRDRVVELDLSGFRLTGSLSPSIGNLSFITSLQLQNNQLTGQIPSQFGNLLRLRVLNMSFNGLEGTIPSNITSCRELRILDLGQNEIGGMIPISIGQLANLEILRLSRNHLIGSIPPSIGNLSSLTVLSLGTNTLNGTIPDELSRLQNLSQLDLTINHLTGTIPPSIYNMSSLTSIALASNDLFGEIPEDIGVTLPNLLVFNFCINRFTGTIPGSLHNLTRIRIIRMAYNLLHGTVPPGLENLRDIEMYNIGFNDILSGDDGLGFLNSFANSSRLNFLAIDGNQFEGVIPDSIGNLPRSLSILYMGGNRLYGTIPPSIGALTGLSLLNISHNSLSGEIPSEIGGLRELQVLSLAGNRFSGEIPSALGDLRRMTELDLSRNELVGIIPTSFGNFQNLLSMDLSSNNLNGSIPRETLNLPSLSTFLNLSRNFLTGPLPREVENLENVAVINLSHNRLSGSIPSSIGNCVSLEQLFMANNTFEGPIPDTIGYLNGLVALDLSSNRLSGVIPLDLQRLRAMQFLNFSFNDLEGEVPRGGVFANNVSNVYLQGNPKLCSNTGCKNSRDGGKRKLIVIVVAVTSVTIVALCLASYLLLYIKKTKVRDVEGSSTTFKGEHRMVTYDELRLGTQNFNRENLIGEGSFGSVFKGYISELSEVAIKVFDIDRTGYWKSFVAECEALRHVRHRNLVKLITSCSSMDSKNNQFLALVYEYMINGSLDDWIRGKRKDQNGEGLNILQRLNVAIDIASALNYLHHDCEDPIVHCDLKPSNVLLSEDMTAKVGDFGLARLLIESNNDQSSLSSTNALKGSIGYIPPEYGMGAKPATTGDVYSFGIMLMELFTGKSPTNESFVGGLTLNSWVQEAFLEEMEQVIDPELLLQMNNKCDDGDNINPMIQLNGLATIVGVGLSCTAESPEGRMNMNDALRKLKGVRDSLLKT